MKSIRLSLLTAICIFAFANSAKSQVNPSSTYVSGYTKSDGTFVSGHYKTTPNNTNRDNYSTKPNVNPYTGSNGYVEPDNKPLNSSKSYSTPVSTGPKGGQYYINSNGNKTYVSGRY